ncbi:NADPH-dependent FMN reductase [Blastococcus sp. SYSU D00820]
MSDHPEPLHVLVIVGSLRENSYNAGLARAFVQEAPSSMAVEVYDRLGDLPHLNDDVFQESGFPAPVADLRNRIEAADAVVLSTPEYAYGPPGVLKNALDWMSYPPPTNPLRFKPVALMGASIGPGGTIRGQNQLRQTLLFFDAGLIGKPEIQVPHAGHGPFDPQGDLKDDLVRELIVELIEEIERFVPANRMRHADSKRPFRFS